MAIRPAVLLVDIGNSRVKWGWARPGLIEPGEPFATRADAEAFARRWADAPAPARIVVANVAGEAIAAALAAFAQRCWGLAPQFVRSQALGFGLANGYAQPEKLGVDRWVALIGARHAWPEALCVADCGTAITVDAVDAEGRHLGGLIAPGLALMRSALARGTHQLGLADAATQGSLGRDTAAAIVLGTRQAAAGLVERAARETARRLGHQPRLLLTGGDAQGIAAELGMVHELRPELVLEGLWAIAQSDG